MYVLSVQQPWAWAIVHGPKRIENRTWAANYTGPLLIHAGKSRARLGAYGPGEPDESELTFGAIIGSVTLIRCVPVGALPKTFSDSPFAEGPVCWLFENPVPLVPFPVPGQMGLFRPPPGYQPQRAR